MLNGVESPQISVVGCLLELFFSWEIVISICIEVVTIIIKCGRRCSFVCVDWVMPRMAKECSSANGL